MRQLKYKLLLTAAAGSLMLAACNKKDLTPIPQTSLSDAVAFSSPERIEQQVFGIYSAMKNGNFLGGRGQVYQEVRGEDWLNVTGNGVTNLLTWNFGVSSTTNEVEGFWNAGYAAINRANVVIEGIAANPTVISAQQANRYTAEARFARAVSYFYLVTLYAKKPYTADNGASPGLPLRLKANKSVEGANLARSSVAQVYDQILADLNYAETNLPLTYATNDSNVVRAHRNAAIAFKTRVYLNMGKYSEVITEGDKIVPQTAPFVAPSGVAHRLEPSVLTVFRSPYNLKESIFSLPMSPTNPPGTQNDLALYWSAEYELNPAGILGSTAWPADDARRTNFVFTSGGKQRLSKFNDAQNNWVPIIRYAEVLLNVAEALARTNTTVNPRAVALLNAVRQRSHPASVLAPLTQAELIDMILTERRIELLGEGFRSMDIMRLQMTFPAKGSGANAVGAIAPTSAAYVWPIPNSELLYNKSMSSNN